MFLSFGGSSDTEDRKDKYNEQLQKSDSNTVYYKHLIKSPNLEKVY